MIKEFSLKVSRNVKLSKNFTVKEFACKDGNDRVIIDTCLVDLLQHVRNTLGKAITITSAYRTPSYNKKIGGASASQHVLGTAADIKVKGVDPVVIAWIADNYLLSTGGVELGSYDKGNGGYVHVDVRNIKWRAIRPTSKNTYTTYSTPFPTLRFGSSGAAVTVLSRKLCKLGYLSSVFTTVGEAMKNGIKSFQEKNGLVCDGVFGRKSWSKLVELLNK